MAKVLVTGGAGFIGSHVVDLLIENGYEVVVVDNLSTGQKDNVHPKASVYNVDICSPELVRVFENEKPDFVIHHAAQANLRVSVKDPIFDANVNIIGSLNLFEQCAKHGVKKIVYASSGGARFGEPNVIPTDENQPVSPVSPYAMSKYAVEKYLHVYKHIYGIDFVILGYTNVYGPRQNPKGEAGVISIFCDNVIKGRKSIIFGDGTNTRDYVYVKDVARANILALEKSTTNSYFNISSGVETSVNQLRDAIKTAFGAGEFEYGAAIKGEVMRSCLSNSLARQELGWQPEHDLAAGLSKTVAWFKAQS